MRNPVIQEVFQDEKIFRLIAENVTDLVAVLDTEGRRIYNSPSYKRLFPDLDSLTGGDSFQYIHPEDHDAVREVFRTTVKTGVGQRFAYRFILQDESIRHIESEGNVIRDAGGRVSSIVVVSRDVTDRKRAEAESLVTRERLALALKNTGLAVFEWNILTDFVFLSEQWSQILGEEPKPVLTTFRQFLRTVDRDEFCAFKDARSKALNGEWQTGELKTAELRITTPAGESKWVECQGRVEQDAKGKAVRICGTFADITERHEAQQKMVRLSNLYAALSQTNQAIVRIRDQAMLFEEICRIAVECGRFKMAWIGLVNRDTQSLEKAASRGEGQEILQSLPWSLDSDRSTRHGPMAASVRANQPYICNDVLGEASMLPWQSVLHRTGFRAAGAFPIKQENEIVGMLSLYADEVDFFDPALVQTLEGMISDISFALDNFQREARRHAAEAALFDSEALKTGILESALDCIITIDDQGRILDFNPAAERTFSYRRAEVMGKSLAETIVPPALRGAHTDGMALYRRTGEGNVLGKRIEVTAMRADGCEFPVELAVTPVRIKGQTVFTAYLRDITEKKQALVSLQESEARYRQLVESSPEAIFVGREGKFELVNPACVRVFKAPNAEALIGQPILNFVHRSFHELIAERIKTIHEKNISLPFIEQRWLHVDGSEFDVEAACAPFVYQGKPAVQTVVRDITERKQIERVLRNLVEGTALSAGEQFFPTLVRGLAMALEVRYAVVTECRDVFVRQAQILAFWGNGNWIPGHSYDIANTPCERLLEESKLCYYPDNLQAHFPGNTRLPALEASCYLGLPLMDHTNNVLGHIYIMDDKPLPNIERAKSVLSIFATHAATELERRRAEESIRHMAHHDALTGLPNRVLLQDRTSQAIAHAQRHGGQVAVLFLDLDRFKNINDTLGHEAGDRGLRNMGARLTESLRGSDTVARVGGDEFMVLINDFSELKYVGEVASKILDTVSQPFFLDGQECHVTGSIGVATYPSDGENVLQLLKNADIAMYRAKALGKNNYQFYSAQMNIHTLERLSLESQLSRAIENNELVVHYQPKIDLATQQITGAEALVRWQHPQRGLIETSDFIPLAEETGLIVPLGLWVLNTACAQVAAWKKQGLPALRIAVNLSARQFVHEGLLHDIYHTLRRSGLDYHQLELEITESAVMHSPVQAAAIMNELKARGVRLTMDDFGTGYSSLAYLKRFPIDSLKIDRSFIQGIPEDADDVALTKTIIAMAHNMKMIVIAEGVETEKQAIFLHSYGCDEYQGYYFSRPVPAEEFVKLLRNVKTLVSV
ncbi:MAG: EAL domain-containing protein [Burkholderiales bacterium]|nr:EAL domain-containing protein [Burkholderiales bacterium]